MDIIALVLFIITSIEILSNANTIPIDNIKKPYQSLDFSLPLYHGSHPKVLKHFNTPQPLSYTYMEWDDEAEMFYVEVSIGSSRASELLVFDTGSNFCWLDQQKYDAVSSSTHEMVPCMDKWCDDVPGSSCTGDNCTFDATYADGRSSKGIVLLDDFYFMQSNGIGRRPRLEVVNVLFGSANETALKHTGVVGMNFDDISLLSSFGVTKYAVCFPKLGLKESTVRFGESVRLPIECTSLSPYDPHVKFHVDYIQIAGFKLTNLSSAVSGGDFIFDTGAKMSHLHKYAMDGVLDIVKRSTSARAVVDPREDYELCFDSDDASLYRKITFSIQAKGGVLMQLPFSSVWKCKASVRCCLAFQRSGTDTNILGLRQMLGTNFGFDVPSRQLCMRNDPYCSFNV